MLPSNHTTVFNVADTGSGGALPLFAIPPAYPNVKATLTHPLGELCH